VDPSELPLVARTRPLPPSPNQTAFKPNYLGVALTPAPIPGGLPGRHLILEFYGASRLDDKNVVEDALRAAVTSAGATLLHLHTHVFTRQGGVTCTAALSESHISIHTWPEYRYAALDIFMCGACDPGSCLPELIKAFCPIHVEVMQLIRGLDVLAATSTSS
jgi:S-adenosylmethionine decarboxylase